MASGAESGSAARDAGIARVRALTRGAAVGAVVLAGGFAGIAAASTHTRKVAKAAPATHVPAQAVRRVTVVPTPVPAPAPSSARPATPQAPVQSSAPPVVSSGGS